MNGKTILITGATDGVGRAVATALGKPGAKVLVHGRDATRAGEVIAGICDAGGQAVSYPADFSSLAEVRALAAKVGKDHPRLDLLVKMRASAHARAAARAAPAGMVMSCALPSTTSPALS